MKKTLLEYKMTKSDKQIWDIFETSIFSMCLKLDIIDEYSTIINRIMKSTMSNFNGYSVTHGYYFGTVDIRGDLYCVNFFSLDKAQKYVMYQILQTIGQNKEVLLRSSLEKQWQAKRGQVINKQWTYCLNWESWIYPGVYDSRFYWMNYITSNMSLLFKNYYLDSKITHLTNALNFWTKPAKYAYDRYYSQFYISNNNTTSLLEPNTQQELSIDENFIKYIEILEELLIQSEKNFWAGRIREAKESFIITNSPGKLLSYYGGMGSLNDLWLCNDKVDYSQDSRFPWRQTLFDNLLSILGYLGDSYTHPELIKDETIRNGTHKFTGDILIRECRNCKHKFVTTFNLNTFIAKATIPELLLECEKDLRHEFIKHCVLGDFNWIAQKQTKLLHILSQHSIFHQNETEVCNKCQSSQLTNQTYRLPTV